MEHQTWDVGELGTLFSARPTWAKLMQNFYAFKRTNSGTEEDYIGGFESNPPT